MTVDLLIGDKLGIHSFARSRLVVDREEVDTVRYLGRALDREATYVARTLGVLDLTTALVELDGLMHAVELDVIGAHQCSEGLACLERTLGKGKLGDGGLVMTLVLSFVGRCLWGGLTAASEDSHEAEGECSEAET